MTDPKMLEQIKSGQGFIAALDQSGGSTPGALKGYGVADDAYSTDKEMYALIHAMRSRIITSPCFGGDEALPRLDLFKHLGIGHCFAPNSTRPRHPAGFGLPSIPKRHRRRSRRS